MKTRYILTCIAALLAFCACNDTKEEVEINGTQLVLTAYQEGSAGSKTAVEDGGKQVFWETGDEIKVFSGSRSGKFTSSAEGLEVVTTFTGHLEGTGPDVQDIWAIYPYREEASFDGECITTVIPSVQVARPGTFAQGANIAIAHSDTPNLHFFNVGGGVRFSLTHEGVNKIVFEGQNGEALSGTVQIAFEDGLPVVKDILDGNLFITVTAPDGGTFSTGVWYYFVTIPRALGKGFKIRFYKDNQTYSKLISDNAVSIKRKIFGSLSNVDESLKYESITSSFPQTEDDWHESEQITNVISEAVSDIISVQGTKDDGLIDTRRFVEQLQSVEGVVDAFCVDGGNGAVVIQSDGVHHNILLNFPDDYDGQASEAPVLGNMCFSPKKSSKVSPASGGKKVLVVAPYQSDNSLRKQYYVDAYSMYNSLSSVGYELDWRPDRYASLDVFTPDSLARYDMVVIGTHGGHDYHDREGNNVGIVYLTGAIEGSVDFDSPKYKRLASFITMGSDKHYAISVPWLESIEGECGHQASFDRTIVIANACYSYRTNAFADYFTDRGASIYYGNTGTVSVSDSMDGLPAFIKYLCMGMSVQNAKNRMRDKDFSVLGRLFFPGLLSNEPFGTTYLINPTPTLLSGEILP